MGNRHPEKTKVDRGEAEVDNGCRGVTISHVTPLCCHIYFYRPPEGGRLYDMNVVSSYVFLRTYYV